MLQFSKARKQIFVTILIVLSIVTIAFSGCSKSVDGSTNKEVLKAYDDEATNKNILDTIKDIEKSLYELNTLKINYNEFNEKTDKFLSPYFKSFYNENSNMYARDDFVKPITGKSYEEKDWKELSSDEFKKNSTKLYNIVSVHNPGLVYTSYEISKLFDDNSGSNVATHYKHMFIKHTFEFNNKIYPSFKKFTFKRENNDYVLFSILHIPKYDEKALTYGKEKVEFIDEISIE